MQFEEWLPIFKKNCESSVNFLKENYNLEMSSQEFASEEFYYQFTRSPLSLFHQIINEKRKLSHPKEHLEDHIIQLECAAKHMNPYQFGDLIQQKSNNLKNWYKDSKSPLSFPNWKKIQQTDPFNASPYLTRCDLNLRNHFLTSIQNNTLIRNGHPLNTKFERVDQQKRCIFVIGPDQNLYCASKVRNVFQHSSFFKGGIVCAAGTLATDEQGQLIFLSNHSGHYGSDQKSDLFMLDYFHKRGIDLSKVTFHNHSSNLEVLASRHYQHLSA